LAEVLLSFFIERCGPWLERNHNSVGGDIIQVLAVGISPNAGEIRLAVCSFWGRSGEIWFAVGRAWGIRQRDIHPLHQENCYGGRYRIHEKAKGPSSFEDGPFITRATID